MGVRCMGVRWVCSGKRRAAQPIDTGQCHRDALPGRLLEPRTCTRARPANSRARETSTGASARSGGQVNEPATNSVGCVPAHTARSEVAASASVASAGRSG